MHVVRVAQIPRTCTLCALFVCVLWVWGGEGEGQKSILWSISRVRYELCVTLYALHVPLSAKRAHRMPRGAPQRCIVRHDNLPCQHQSVSVSGMRMSVRIYVYQCVCEHASGHVPRIIRDKRCHM